MEDFAHSSRDLLMAVNDNAPFYSAEIRQASNDTQRAASRLFHKHLKAVAEIAKGGVDMRNREPFASESKRSFYR